MGMLSCANAHDHGRGVVRTQTRSTRSSAAPSLWRYALAAVYFTFYAFSVNPPVCFVDAAGLLPSAKQPSEKHVEPISPDARSSDAWLVQRREPLRELLYSNQQPNIARGRTCLSPALMDEILDAATRTWRVDESALRRMENDLQRLIECALDGDTVLFDLRQPIQLRRRLEITKKLTLGTVNHDGSDAQNRLTSRSAKRTIFQCPHNDGAFYVRDGQVTLLDIAFRGCSPDSAAILEIVGCNEGDATGSLSLKGVAFEGNRLNGTAAISLRGAPCYSVKMEGVRFENNVCSAGVCFAELSRENRLKNLQLRSNRPPRDAASDGVLIALPPGSRTHAVELYLSQNRIPALRVKAAVLEMSTSVFFNNTGSVIHLVGVGRAAGGARISLCTFSGNHAFGLFDYGAALRVDESEEIEVERCAFANNNATNGGAVYAAKSEMQLRDCRFRKNEAESNGGAVAAEDGTRLTIRRTKFMNNTARLNGGAIHLEGSDLDGRFLNFSKNACRAAGAGIRALENCNVTLSHSTMKNQNASIGAGMACSASTFSLRHVQIYDCYAHKHGGGIVVSDHSEITIENSELSRNRGETSGGGIRCNESTLKAHSVILVSNSADHHGGGFMINNGCNLTLQDSKLVNNTSSTYGGGLSLVSQGTSRAGSRGVVLITGAVLEDNTAGFEGGAIYAERSNLTIHRSDFSGNKAEKGGCIALRVANAEIHTSAFHTSEASGSGGALDVRRKSDLFLNLTQFRDCTAKDNGGALFVTHSAVQAVEMRIEDCTAQHKGGAMHIGESTSLACLSCRFRNNRANRFGGALSISSVESPQCTHQLLDCSFHNNTAPRGGAVYHLTDSMGSSITYLAIFGTTFRGNEAHVGGALFITDPAALKSGCQYRRDVDGVHVFSKAELDEIPGFEHGDRYCDAWVDNRAQLFGNFVATPARNVRAFVHCTAVAESVNCADKDDFTPWPNEVLTVPKHKSGESLPQLRFEVVDALGNGPAPGTEDAAVVATMSSPDGLFKGNISVQFEDGYALFKDILVFQKAYSYNVRVAFSEPVLPVLTVNVTIRPCVFGEYTDPGEMFCGNCSANEYNFEPEKPSCQECPERGDCSSTSFILPMAGSWHSDPCSSYIDRCIRDEACQYDGRPPALTNLTNGLETCDPDGAYKADYRQTQCDKGYTEVLCGSCEGGYGRRSSFRCEVCYPSLVSVLFCLLSLLWLVLLTGLAIRGNLSPQAVVSRLNLPSFLPDTSTRRRVIEMAELPRDAVTVSSEDENTQSPVDHQVTRRQAELIKELLVEIFKIAINFLQIIALALTIHVDWTDWLRRLFSSADFLGGAGTESVFFPLYCLFPVRGQLRAVLGTLIFFTMPLTVFLIFVVFWTAMAYRSKMQRGSLSRRLLLSALLVVYISYESMTETAVGILNCVGVHDTADAVSVRYWAMDTSLKCHEGLHRVLEVAVAGPVIVLLSFGFPVGLALVLKLRKPSDRRNDAATGFLYRAYKRRYVYWESVVMLRKAVLVVIASFGYTLGGNVQGVLAVCTLTLALYTHTVLRPFREEVDALNSYEGASLVISHLIFASGLFFSEGSIKSAEARDLVRFLLTGAVVFMATGLMGFFLCKLLASGVLYSRMVLELDGVSDAQSWGTLRVLVHYSKLRLREHCRNFKEFMGYGEVAAATNGNSA